MSPDDGTDDLRTAVLRVVGYNMRGLQPDSVAEHVVVELLARDGTDPTTVRAALATLIDEGDLERLAGKRAPRYRLVAES